MSIRKEGPSLSRSSRAPTGGGACTAGAACTCAAPATDSLPRNSSLMLSAVLSLASIVNAPWRVYSSRIPAGSLAPRRGGAARNKLATELSSAQRMLLRSAHSVSKFETDAPHQALQSASVPSRATSV